jgi:hypothetical protein
MLGNLKRQSASSPPKKMYRFPSRTLYATQPEVFRIAAQKGMGFRSCGKPLLIQLLLARPYIASGRRLVMDEPFMTDRSTRPEPAALTR